MRLFIAIDDTDNPDTFGTGRLSRMLARELESQGLLGPASVTRHQLLVHPEIPYTSHNSASCLQAQTDSDLDEVFNTAVGFMESHLHQGANPALCLVPAEEVPEALVDLGGRAKRQVLKVEEGYELARTPSLRTWRHGPTGQGIIGALSAVGLRRTGSDGRFIDLAGIRDIGGVVKVAEILARTGVETVATPQGRELAGDELVDTMSWVRPSLRQNHIVYLVSDDRGVWRPALKRKKNEDDGQAGQ